jgi:hypothetical protein
MKIARFVLKIVALSLSVVAAACCIVAYWDKITALAGGLSEKVAEKKAAFRRSSEYDDYADWDEG